MGFKSLIAKQVVNAFVQLQDIPRPMTYKQLVSVAYDIEAGTPTTTYADYPLTRVVKTKFTIKEEAQYKAVVAATDAKMLFPVLDLPVEPNTADTLIDEDGLVWEIVKRLTDPSVGVWILWVRSSQAI